MQLSEQQLNRFHTFGYLSFPGLLKGDIDWITEGFEEVMATACDGRPHDGSARTSIVPTIDHHEKLCTLLDDARILGIASALLGDDFNYASGDGNFYTGDTGWHPDGDYPELFAVKVAFYLDSVGRDSGALRVIPGSHHAESPWRTQGLRPREAAAVWGVCRRRRFRETWRWRASRATWWSSTTTCCTPRSAAARAGECSR